MNTGKTFNAIFWALFVLMFLMRFWFGFRVWRTWRTVDRLRADRAAHQRESLGLRAIEQVFWLLVAVVVLLWFQGNNLRSLAFPAPN